ncbi:peptide deformylase [Camelimonas lactis]|uniref:Peptide deformylase-like n=2 Tax=Camelimonas lactis TaxID=659006 RepID=A0A4R2GPV7_9HYPH|nr:peptide deformylase [Camelimonas lactis]
MGLAGPRRLRRRLARRTSADAGIPPAALVTVMTVRSPVRWPDPRLAEASRPVAAFDAALRALADELLAMMRAAPGVGATAAHMGVPLRLFAIELPGDAGPRFYVNAEIIEASAQMQSHTEGSISMPGAHGEVTRPARVRVRWQDLDGALHEEAADGFRAACLQHEIDQMDGIFWLQRLSRLKRDRIIARWRMQMKPA